jgi:hypothetical protein
MHLLTFPIALPTKKASIFDFSETSVINEIELRTLRTSFASAGSLRLSIKRVIVWAGENGCGCEVVPSTNSETAGKN